tara:strand:+ start:53 stop:265 length:213 start_codon:yes stop_codon:yes gene_type:complete
MGDVNISDESGLISILFDALATAEDFGEKFEKSPAKEIFTAAAFPIALPIAAIKEISYPVLKYLDIIQYK